MNWKLIETVPTDMTDVLLYCPADEQYDAKIVVGCKNGFGETYRLVGWNVPAIVWINPTHWMPLPIPP